METAKKCSPVSEYAPDGYDSWHAYNVERQRRRKAVRDVVSNVAAALAAVAAYALMLGSLT